MSKTLMNTPSGSLLDELERVNAGFATSTPLEILAWTFDRFGDDVAMACSFEDLALLHMVHQLRPATQIIFLDTGGHFHETLEFVASIEREWSLSLTRTHPSAAADEWPCGSDRCCELRKVAPLAQAIAGRPAWITALKRSDGPSRATMKILSWDDKFGLAKVNPLATWSDDDVAYYLHANGLREHPLWSEGYASIGCEKVTTKPQISGDRRSGRWVGAEKEECGLHEA